MVRLLGSERRRAGRGRRRHEAGRHVLLLLLLLHRLLLYGLLLHGLLLNWHRLLLLRLWVPVRAVLMVVMGVLALVATERRLRGWRGCGTAPAADGEAGLRRRWRRGARVAAPAARVVRGGLAELLWHRVRGRRLPLLVLLLRREGAAGRRA